MQICITCMLSGALYCENALYIFYTDLSHNSLKEVLALQNLIRQTSAGNPTKVLNIESRRLYDM